MSDIKEVLAEAFVDEPPMTVDKPALIRAGRREVVRRYAFVGAVMALVVVAAVTVPSVLWSGEDTTLLASSPSPTSETTSTPPDRGFVPAEPARNAPGLPPPRPVTSERAAELSALLKDAMPDGVVSRAIPGQPWGVLEFSVPAQAPGTYFSHTELVTARGHGSVAVQIFTKARGARDGCPPDELPGYSCSEWEVDGKHVRAAWAPNPGALELSDVRVWWPDGTLVIVSGFGSSTGGGHVLHPMPLDFEQLVNLATQPWLTF
ncbi:MAG: hypothetical protein HOV94_08705 [Saccharothrix sp.]|nr:hypothetical protein [Saccharothrix sp.]